MPGRPPKPCSCAGCKHCNGRCPALTTGGKCAGCGKQYQKLLTHDPERQAIYRHPRWKALRRQVRKEQPFCIIDGCGRPWTELDHEPPLRDVLERGGDPFSREGTRGMCRVHHAQKTANELRLRRKNQQNE